MFQNNDAFGQLLVLFGWILQEQLKSNTYSAKQIINIMLSNINLNLFPHGFTLNYQQFSKINSDSSEPQSLLQCINVCLNQLYNQYLCQNNVAFQQRINITIAKDNLMKKLQKCLKDTCKKDIDIPMFSEIKMKSESEKHKVLSLFSSDRANWFRYYIVFHLIQMQRLLMSPLINKITTKPYKHLLQTNLTFIIQNIADSLSNNIQLNKIKQKLIIRIRKIIKITQDSQEGIPEYYNNSYSWIIVLILIFTNINQPNNYCPYLRRMLKAIFQQFSTEISQPIQILQILQSISLEKNNTLTNPFYPPSLHNQFKEYTLQRLCEIQRIEFGKNKDLTTPTFYLRNVSRIKDRRRMVNILVSGFLSENNDKQFEWQSLLNLMKDSEVYALEWESSTIYEMAKFIISTLKDVLLANDAQSKIKAMVLEINKKFNSNPFTVAFQQSQITGKYLGKLLVDIFQGQTINFIGYSLGTQLIISTLRAISKQKKECFVNKVVFMGGVSDNEDVFNCISGFQHPIQVVNYISSHDSVLQYLLKACKPEINPIGICKIEIQKLTDHLISNVDCSEFVIGHLAYMMRFKKLGQIASLQHQ